MHLKMERNKEMKQILKYLLIVFMTVSAGCAQKPAEETDTGSLRIVTTLFPYNDWVAAITENTGTPVQTRFLLNSGSDLHSFQPSASDIAAISECNLFIYTGGESDEWTEDALRQSSNENRIVINLMDVLKDHLKEEEMKEGMQEEDHEHEETEFDEHVWLSLRNAQLCCEAIEEALSSLLPDESSLFKENLEAYVRQLQQLDSSYAETVQNGSVHTLLFADRFPFRYMIEDYGLDYYAAFAGCSAEAEASFETIRFLAEKCDELQLKNILVLESSDRRLADTIIDTAIQKDINILELNSLQSMTQKDADQGITYLQIMENNLEILKKAVN